MIEFLGLVALVVVSPFKTRAQVDKRKAFPMHDE
jgi:hypothetical protein